MQIAQPLWLIAALAGAALLFWSYRRQERSRAALLGAFTSSRLVRQLTRSVSMQLLWMKRAAMIAATVCICVALARPQGGYTIETVHRRGLDILVAIDTSKSMLTPDVKPNRLTRSKLAAEDLLAHLNGDGIGLIAFAGDAFLQTPITTDYDAFRDSVEALDTNTIPRGGTDIASPIKLAEATFKGRPGSDRILILMTDGEDLDARGVAAARAAAQQGVRIFTIGVGTAGGDLIPVPDGSGGRQYRKDSSGQLVRSHLDVATLQQIAQAAGGLYEPLGNAGQGLDLVYSRGLASFTRHDLAEQRLRVYTEWFQWPLLAGIVLLMLESLLLTRRRRLEQPDPVQVQKRHPLAKRTDKTGSAASARNTGQPDSAGAAKRVASLVPVAILTLGLGITTLPDIAHASAADAEKAYARGNYAQASKEYEASARKRPSMARLQFNVGAAAYKSGDLKTATTAFQTAVKNGDPAVQESAYYNLGNTEYRVGQHTQQAQPQTTLERWQAAVKSYETALQLRPGDADAKFNRDLVQRKLAQLQQQEKQKQSQQQSGAGQQSRSSGGGGQQQKAGHGSKQGQGEGEKQGQDQGQAQGQKQAQGGGQQQGQGAGQTQGQQQGQREGQPKGEGAGASQTARNANPTEQRGGNGTSTPGSGEPQPPADTPPRPTPESSSPNAARGSGTPVAAASATPTQPANSSATDGPAAGPGQLTREEADRLLDSLKGDTRRLATASQGPNAAPDDNAPPLKDW